MADLSLDPYQGVTHEELRLCLREELLKMGLRPHPVGFAHSRAIVPSRVWHREHDIPVRFRDSRYP